MARKTRPTWQTAIVILSSAVVAALVVGGLYWAKSVLVPLAVAIFFTFLLSPLVTRLQRGVGRVAAVLLVVTLAALVIVGVGWVVTVQFSDLAAELDEPRAAGHLHLHGHQTVHAGTVCRLHEGRLPGWATGRRRCGPGSPTAPCP